MSQPSNMEIGSCWYWKLSGSMWNLWYDWPHHGRLENDICVGYDDIQGRTNLYELYPINEIIFHDFVKQ